MAKVRYVTHLDGVDIHPRNRAPAFGRGHPEIRFPGKHLLSGSDQLGRSGRSHSPDNHPRSRGARGLGRPGRLRRERVQGGPGAGAQVRIHRRSLGPRFLRRVLPVLLPQAPLHRGKLRGFARRGAGARVSAQPSADHQCAGYRWRSPASLQQAARLHLERAPRDRAHQGDPGGNEDGRLQPAPHSRRSRVGGHLRSAQPPRTQALRHGPFQPSTRADAGGRRSAQPADGRRGDRGKSDSASARSQRRPRNPGRALQPALLHRRDSLLRVPGAAHSRQQASGGAHRGGAVGIRGGAGTMLRAGKAGTAGHVPCFGQDRDRGGHRGARFLPLPPGCGCPQAGPLHGIRPKPRGDLVR